MIRRISANNDYRDIVRSCPSGVIDDIYAIEYYVNGYDGVYSAAFSKTGSLLEVIIPSSALKTLHSGVLMRRAKYRNADTSFPDQYYDLEFVEDMNVWLENGSEPGPGPVPGEYVTEEELAETLEGYVTDQELSDAVNALGAHINAVDDRVTALEQNPGGVTQEEFDAHKAENAAQFSGIDQSLSNLNQLVQKAQIDAGDAIQENIAQDDRLEAIDAKNAEQDDRLTALEQNPGGVSQEQFAAHVAQNNDLFNNLQGVTEENTVLARDNSQRISALENAGFATRQDLAAVDATVRAVGGSVDNLDQRVTGLDQRVTGLENAGFATQQDLAAVDAMVRAVGDSVDNLDHRVTDIENVDFQGQIDGLDQRVTDLEQGGVGSGTWGSITGTITDQTDLVNYVDQAIEDAISGSDVPLPENVVEYEDTTSGWMSVLSDYDDDCDILKRPVDDEYTGGGVHEANTKNLVLGYHRTYDEHSTEQDITLIEVGRNSNGTMTLYKHVIIDGYEGDNNGHQLIPYVTSEDLSDYVSRSYLSYALSGYATQSWVGQQGYLTSSDLSGYATESWVGQQGYLDSNSTLPADQITCNISGDVFDFENVDAGLTALVSRVEDQMDNITSLDNRVTDIENAGYATQTWATNQFLEESKVWSGTETQWNQLTAEEKASYTIALITQ